MKITAIAADLALAATVIAGAPVEAQNHAYGHYGHGYGRPYGYDHGGYVERGYGHPYGNGRPYGYGDHGYRPRGYGYGGRRLVCRYRFGERRCFRAY